MNSRGFTLIELMISVGMMALLSFMIFNHLGMISVTKKNFEDVAQAETDFAEIYYDLKRITDRSREIGYSHTVATTPPPGYLIYGDGAIGFRADMSPCNTFSPLTPVFTPVVILCCKKGMATNSPALTPPFKIPQTLPPSGTPMGSMYFAPKTSACTTTDGLSIEVGGTKVCHSHVTEIRLAKMGHHSSYGTPLMLLDIKSNRSLTGTTTGTYRGLSVFFGLGYSGSASVTFCSKSMGLN